MFWRLRNVLSARLQLPDLEGRGADFPVRTGGHQVAAGMEVIINETMGGKEILSLTRRLKTLHLAFPAPCRPMRVLGSIVEIPALPMLNFWQDLTVGHAITLQFVGDDHAGFVLQTLQ